MCGIFSERLAAATIIYHTETSPLVGEEERERAALRGCPPSGGSHCSVMKCFFLITPPRLASCLQGGTVLLFKMPGWTSDARKADCSVLPCFGFHSGRTYLLVIVASTARYSRTPPPPSDLSPDTRTCTCTLTRLNNGILHVSMYETVDSTHKNGRVPICIPPTTARFCHSVPDPPPPRPLPLPSVSVGVLQKSRCCATGLPGTRAGCSARRGSRRRGCTRASRRSAATSSPWTRNIETVALGCWGLAATLLARATTKRSATLECVLGAEPTRFRGPGNRRCPRSRPVWPCQATHCLLVSCARATDYEVRKGEVGVKKATRFSEVAFEFGVYK